MVAPGDDRSPRAPPIGMRGPLEWVDSMADARPKAKSGRAVGSRPSAPSDGPGSGSRARTGRFGGGRRGIPVREMVVGEEARLDQDGTTSGRIAQTRPSRLGQRGV